MPSYAPMAPVAVPRPVQRIEHIAGLCRNREVLDLGAMDETAFNAKRGRGKWLHEEIALVARRVTGVDNSALLPPEGLATAPNGRILPGDMTRLDEWIATHQIRPEVVVAGELIEHLENPLAFLKLLRATEALRGCTLVLSTPNATAIHNCLVGVLSRESTHPDHLCILSYKTLSTLFQRAGFRR